VKIALRCMSCRASKTFKSVEAAKKARWKFEDVEINGNWSPIILCSGCNDRWTFNMLVRERVKQACASRKR